MLIGNNEQTEKVQNKGFPPNLIVPNEEGELVPKYADKESRLLGVNFGQYLIWRYHLVDGEKPLLPALRRQAGALKFLSRNIPERSRKSLAEGFVLSRLKILLPLWGGTTLNFHRKLQVIKIMQCKERKTCIYRRTNDQMWLVNRKGTDGIFFTDGILLSF